MAAPYKDIDPEELKDMAWSYIQECMESTKEIATSAGVKKIKERHLPTIAFFLNIWLPLKDFQTYSRQQFYNIIKDDAHPLFDTIKNIDATFSALATDIVANEGKGIFYAKNKLGMTDKQETRSEMNITGLTTEVIKSQIPLAGKESEIIQ